ncbi:MAG TPA: hypothetical protein VJU84_19155 [Pyrinomonadaceae bacterium]|nr:hypothetical protein [Pyrinomonadaceae bacterium]
MSEEQTQNFGTDNQILRQVLAKLEVMDTRLQFVETNVSKRGYDTKPIWERALSEIGEVKNELSGFKQEFSGFKQEFSGFKQEFSGFKQEFSGFKQEFSGFKQEFSRFKQEFSGFK